nr:hypothetical protein [Mycobacterium uberis]
MTPTQPDQIVVYRPYLGVEINLIALGERGTLDAPRRRRGVFLDTAKPELVADNI